MRILSKSNENEMVLAFLKAEIESPRFGNQVKSRLTAFGYGREIIIDKADLSNQLHNQIRIRLLDFRGYQSRDLLFKGFPMDVKWDRVTLDRSSMKKLKYANYPTWTKLSRGSRLVIDGAKNIEDELVTENGHSINKSVMAVAEAIQSGKQYADLIGVWGENDEVILVEGHTRSTAYAMTNRNGIRIIVGDSSKIKDWIFY